MCKSVVVTDAELAHSRQSCASYREGSCHNITGFMYTNGVPGFQEQEMFYGLKLGVDERLQMVELDCKNTYLLSQKKKERPGQERFSKAVWYIMYS